MERKKIRGSIKIITIISAIIGVFFRIILYLNTKLTIDENFTLNLIELGTGEFLGHLSYDAHPPLSYLVFYILNTLSSNLLFLRLYPLTLSLLLPLISYKYMKKIFENDEAACITVIIISTTPNLIFLGSLLRMYSQFIFLSSISIYKTLETIKDHKKKNSTGKIFNKNMIIIIVVNIFNVYTHYFALILILIEVLSVIISKIFQPINKNTRNNNRNNNLIKEFISLLLLSIIPVIIFIPWVSFAWSSTSSMGNYFDFQFNNSFAEIFHSLMNLESGLWPQSSLSDMIRGINIFLIAYLCLYAIYVILKNLKNKNNTYNKNLIQRKQLIILLELITGIIIIFFICLIGSQYFIAHSSRYFSFLTVIITIMISSIFINISENNYNKNKNDQENNNKQRKQPPFISVLYIWILFRCIGFIFLILEYYTTDLILLN